jgi:hypothetical protein
MCNISVRIYGLRRKKKGPIILVALTAQKIPTPTPNDGISWIYRRFYAW